MKEKEYIKRIVNLSDALIEGIDSGASYATIDSIWEEAINEYSAEQ